MFNHRYIPFYKVFIIGICLLLSIPASTQNSRTVSGRVLDGSEGTPLIGATVSVKGTTTGTVTDVNGNYTLKINSPDDILVFSYVGYLPEETTMGDRSVVDMSLIPDITEFDEVVVVGYGTQRKVDLTGAVSVISSKDVEKANANNVARAIQGRAAGVMVTSSSGQPGSEMNIRVRGVGSINNKAQPIVVIDGIITSTGDLNTLNPQDIESISILKDAAASAIYGAQSSNGVILVTTKKGKSGEAKAQFNAQFGFSSIPKQMDIMNSDEYVNYYQQAYAAHNARFEDFFATNPGLQRVFPPPYTDSARAVRNYNSTDWQDAITNDQALNQNYNLSLTGGTEKATYLFSGTYVSDEGTLKTTKRELTTVRLNTQFQLGKRITVGENMALIVSGSREAQNANSWVDAVVASPLMPVYHPTNKGGFHGPQPDVTASNDRTNPLAILELNEFITKRNKIFGNVFAEVEILKGLSFKSIFGINYANTLNTEWSPAYQLGQRSNNSARLSENPVFFTKTQWDQLLTYTTSFSEHNLSILAGHTAEEQNSNAVTGSTNDYRWESLRTLANGNPVNSSSTQSLTPIRGESYFGRLTYDYKGRYLLTGTIRRDGSSKFGPQNRWGTFPAFSLGWKINEDFLTMVDQINTLKLRFGWGKSGNLPDGSFLYDTFISTYNEHVYTLGSGASQRAVFGAAPFYNFGTPSLQWEEAIMTNIGFDLAMFNNRLEFTIEYYDKKYEKLLTKYPLKVFFGLSGDAQPPWFNLGDMQNQGFEFNLIWKKHSGNFTYSLNANLTTNRNEIVKLPETSNGEIHNNTIITLIGYPIGTFYGYVDDGLLQVSDFRQDENGNLVKDATGAYIPLVPYQNQYTQPGDIKFKDLNHDGKISEDDKTVIGKAIPDFTYGFNIDLAYKFFDVNILFQGMQNVDVFNKYWSRGGLASGDADSKDENKLRVAQEHWTPENPVTDQTSIGLSDYNNNARFSTWWLEDASFLRLRNLQFGVTIPAKYTEAVNIANARIYVGGENLFVLTGYRGYDPEVTGGRDGDSQKILTGNVDEGRYPVPRVVTFGLNVNF